MALATLKSSQDARDVGANDVVALAAVLPDGLEGSLMDPLHDILTLAIDLSRDHERRREFCDISMLLKTTGSDAGVCWKPCLERRECHCAGRSRQHPGRRSCGRRQGRSHDGMWPTSKVLT